MKYKRLSAVVSIVLIVLGGLVKSLGFQMGKWIILTGFATLILIYIPLFLMGLSQRPSDQ